MRPDEVADANRQALLYQRLMPNPYARTAYDRRTGESFETLDVPDPATVEHCDRVWVDQPCGALEAKDEHGHHRVTYTEPWGGRRMLYMGWAYEGERWYMLTASLDRAVVMDRLTTYGKHGVTDTVLVETPCKYCGTDDPEACSPCRNLQPGWCRFKPKERP